MAALIDEKLAASALVGATLYGHTPWFVAPLFAAVVFATIPSAFKKRTVLDYPDLGIMDREMFIKEMQTSLDEARKQMEFTSYQQKDATAYDGIPVWERINYQAITAGVLLAGAVVAGLGGWVITPLFTLIAVYILRKGVAKGGNVSVVPNIDYTILFFIGTVLAATAYLHISAISLLPLLFFYERPNKKGAKQ